ncbi:uncharacterized protein LOC133568236 [Nerophis ophidion]|uniref:uncharacterized protein LOC133568236 n=1 Tax=Nerophis ophidion TaxID=159077 RepID=UPI002AE01374|nr:uncharacterized protein LOC133568236 [Nerophis ophidion]
MATSHSGSSKTSVSTASAALVRAKAEVAEVQASYASQEAKLKLEEAKLKLEKAHNQLETTRITTELEVLTLQREADAAEAEAKVLEEASGAQSTGDDRKTESEKANIERTSEYVQSQIDLQQQLSSLAALCPAIDKQPYPLTQATINTWHLDENTPYMQPSPNRTNFKSDKESHLSTPNLNKPVKATTNSEEKRQSGSNIHAPPYVPQQVPQASILSSVEPLAHYLATRDLITSGLYYFADKPEDYRAWESSFTTAVSGAHLTTTQELDLMTKWLGKESGEHVRRIRSMYVNHPELALHKAWERLRDCYATPEIIEKSRFDRLDNFPKISNKDNARLRELGDLLMEIQGFKKDGYVTGLSYLDTSRGIRPIVDKLPYSLQEKWTSSGFLYKEHNNGCFPPFHYFCVFVCSEAKKRNDPSFTYQYNTTANLDKHIAKGFNSNRPITVHKTDILTTNSDPNECCPLHNKPHPLKKCRTFRNKSLDDRKAFLKEKGICFKCCSSVSHLAKQCQSSVKCYECGNTHHEAAMHPGQSPQMAKAPPSLKEYGGEAEEQYNMPDVSTSCTDVCSQGQWGRSCSKICLTKMYHKNFKDKAIKAYVILDDQSNRSLARPELFKMFNVDSKPITYHLRTCSGLVEAHGREAEGFQIESLDGKVLISLPTLLECIEIPNNWNEIPTPTAVLHQPHLHHIAKHIPELDPGAQILLLLGRDVIRAHKVRQQVNGPHAAPFAQCLDLGWVVMGEVCLGNTHKPTINSMKTNVWENGRHSIFLPCTSVMCVKKQQTFNQSCKSQERMLGSTVFNQTEHNNKPAPSMDDLLFLKIMDIQTYRDGSNNWVAPLLFKEPRQRLPNNKAQAIKRFMSLQ